MKPTDRPWEYATEKNGSSIFNSDIGTIATLSDHYGTPHEANAALIVQAVNSHEEITNILLRLVEKVDRANSLQHSRQDHTIQQNHWAELYQLTAEARAALKLAGE